MLLVDRMQECALVLGSWQYYREGKQLLFFLQRRSIAGGGSHAGLVELAPLSTVILLSTHFAACQTFFH